MERLLRLRVSLRTLLLLGALLKISQTQSFNDECENETEKFTTTTTFGLIPNCNLSIENNTISNGTILNLTPGAVYQIFIWCWNCSTNVTMKPEAVRNLTATEITTSSVFLNWTKPEGQSSSYRVQWTDGKVIKNESTNETSKTITGLTPGVQYGINVSAVAGDGHTEGENVFVSIYTKPEAVRNLTATEITTSSVFLNWTKPEGQSSSYRVQWTDGKVIKNESTNETSKTITDLTPGVQYEIIVSAVAGDGHTEGVNVSVSIYTKPEAVRNLTATEITTSSVFLNWTKPEGQSSSYRVQWTDGKVIKNESTNETSKTITDLTPGVQYEIIVSAVAGDGHTEGANVSVSIYTKPEAVRNLTATEITTSSVFLNWTEPEGQSSSYRVQWTDGKVIKNESTNETSKTITGLTPGVQYEIIVSAVAGDGHTEGVNVSVSIYTKPEAVRNLTATEITTSSVFLNWTKPEGQSSSYRVQWTDGKVIKNESTNETSKTITGLTPGVQYGINVSAVAGDGHTEGENVFVSIYTKPEAVRNLTATEITTSSVFLNWTKPEGQSSSYRVQWTDGKVNKNESTNETSKTITGLTPGVQYGINVSAVAGDGHTEGANVFVSIYTKPEAVRNLTATEITTSSVFLNWTKPEGQSSSYRVQWTDGKVNKNESTNETSKTITGLTPGVQYGINVSAVAGDGHTEGANVFVSIYTKPEAVRNLTATEITTSSVFLNWTKPEGQSSSYRVQWTDGKVIKNESTNETSKTITGLTPGVQYGINVSAVAGDGHTEGANVFVSIYTKPGKIELIDVVNNTTSISLNWTSPPGEVFKYRVEWHNGGALMTKHVNVPVAVLSDLIPGTAYTITIIAVARDNNTGQPSTFTEFTKPAVVRNLTIINVTTSSVFLKWTGPEGNATLYKIYWTYAMGEGFSNTSGTSFTIPDLIPGFQYNISVAAAVDSSKEGERTSITTFTRPVKPGNITIIARGTDNLYINWTLPEGKVDHYVVNISNEELMHLNSSTTKVTTAAFTDLHPGRIFIITVTAVAGKFSDTSYKTSFATVPTPPGPIFIRQTNSSLHLKWASPAYMEGASNISYHITYQSQDGEVQNQNTIVNYTELPSLSSGTLYNVTVETVGPQNLRSTVVRNSCFTLPNPVLNLAARPESTTSVQVNWSYPQGHQLYYQYLVETYNTTGALFNKTVNTNRTIVTNLEPGTGYNISVRTIAATGSESTADQTFTYTMPKAVTNLRVDNVTPTAIRLIWLKQSDHKPSYSYLVEALNSTMVVHSNSTEKETYTFYDLFPGTLYTFKVFTVVKGIKSIVASTSNYTTPEAVSGIIAIGSTTNMYVSWSPASGQVNAYTVKLYKKASMQLLEGNGTDLSNATVNKLFQDLKPGVVYCVVVVTKSGPVESYSETVCNATFPNPPGPIMVESQTVESINFTWLFPEDMDRNQYNFTVFPFNSSSLTTANNWFLLNNNLMSGSPYNISVVTVGVLNYESTAVTAENYTRPYSVTMLRQAGITANAVTLTWEQPQSKPKYSYLVQHTNGSSVLSEHHTSNTTATITGLLSGSNYSFTVTTQTADGTQAAPVTVSYFTRPYSISQLEAETLNTTAVRLVWLKPPEYKNEYTYRVKTTGCGPQNNTFTGEVALISELTPGTNCTFCVFVRAADGIEGEAKCTSQYTKPETVQPCISSQGSNSSILLSWTKPAGRVEYYKVHLNSSSTALVQDSVNTSVLFKNLSAGRPYSGIVTTYSGPFNASSGFVTNATFPNPPGPIEILAKTKSSIDIRWMEAPLMTGASLQYQLTLSPGSKLVHTDDTNHTFDSLLSGTSYNISLATVGAMGFESEKVQIHMVTTRPFSVKDLWAFPEEENIMVKWKAPDEYKETYRYNLTWQTSDGPISSKITREYMFNIDNLVPGTHYDFSVTTETSDGTQGDPRRNSSCTNASQVENLKCEGLNKSNAELILSWSRPSGHFSGFQVTVNNDNNSTNTSTCCRHLVSNLRHYTEYNLTVKTLSCGKSSTPVFLRCRTNITNPPIPENYELLLEFSVKSYNRFSIQINSNLLNDINGPITHVGVLVTNNAPGDTSNLKEYLGNTYTQWKAKRTPVYLATVKDITPLSRSGEESLNIDIGDESKWEDYTNGVLEAKGKYQVAIALFTRLILQGSLVNVETSLVSVTNFVFTIQLPDNPAISLAIGVTLGIFFVLFIILIGFIIYWKRLSKKESPDIQIHSMRAKVSVAVRVEDFEAYYKKQRADSNCGFAEEFEDLKVVGTGQSKTSALTVENKPKNRYNNVLPYDSSRVKLSIIHGSPYDDYINANYMPGYNSRKEFIAAQGPLPTTVNDFWRMIWEKNVQTLVMLTRCNEQGRVKCEQYWDSGTKHFDNITVTATSAIPLDDWTIRDFDVKNVKTAETRSVRHFHFTAWPDHGVPETTELLISFRHLVREHMDQYSRHSPTVVHCSAGVGRTGTFIAIDRLIFQIERENIVDVYGIVHDLRMHRPLMVQTEDQYVFLNQCALDIIRSRTGTNVDLIYQNTAALSIYENVERKKGFPKNGYHNA